MLLGEVLVRFGAETSGLMRGIEAAKGGLASLAGLAVVAGVAIAAVLGFVAVKAAADFQQGLVRLKTGAGDVTDNLAKMGRAILQVSTATGVMTTPLLQAMYLIISSGQRGAQALDTLSVAAKGAQIEQAKVVDVANVLSGAMTNYGTKQFNATQFMNGFIVAVQQGKITLQQLAVAMGPIDPIAQQLGIHFNDVAAAMTTQTNAMIPAARAATGLRFMMLALENPTHKAKVEMAALGLDSVKVANEMKVSLPGALQMIVDAAKKVGPEGSVPFNRAVADMVGGIRGLSAFTALTGPHLKDFARNSALILEAMKKNKDAVIGWDTVQGNFNLQMDKAKTALNALAITVGTALLPVLTQIVQNLVPLITKFADWVVKSHAVENAIQFVQNAIKAVTPYAQAMGAAFMAVMPMIVQLWVAFSDVVQRAGKWLSENKGFMEALKYVVIALGVAVGVILLAAFVAVVAAIAAVVIVIVVVIAIVQAFIAVGRALGDVWNRTITFIVDQWNILASAAVDVWGRIGAAWNAGVAFVQNIVSAFVNAIITFFTWLAHNLVGGSIIPDMINNIIQWFAQLPGRVMGAIQALLGLVVGFFVGLGNQVRTIVTALIAAAVAIFAQLPGRALAAVQGLVGMLAGFFSGLASQALTWGGNIIRNLAAGIQGAIGAVATAVGNVVSFIASHLPHSPAKVGPLRDLDKSGEEIVRQLSAGMLHAKPNLQASLNMAIVPGGTVTGGTGGGPNEIITLLRSIDKKLDNGQPVSRYQLTQALGLLLADGVRR